MWRGLSALEREGSPSWLPMVKLPPGMRTMPSGGPAWRAAWAAAGAACAAGPSSKLHSPDIPSLRCSPGPFFLAASLSLRSISWRRTSKEGAAGSAEPEGAAASSWTGAGSGAAGWGETVAVT
jgi:hypothetical protein